MTAFRPYAGRHLVNLRKRFYRIFIEPHQAERDARNREVVFNVVLFGTGTFMLALFVLLLISFFVVGNHHVLGRLLVAIAAIGLVAGLYWLSRRVSYQTSAYLLIGFYVLLAAGSVYEWGIRTPFGILLLGLVIVLASTILSSRHALYAAVVAIAVVFLVQLSNEIGWHVPHAPAMSTDSGFGDVLGHSVFFGLLATISWLFGRGMERSLSRAEAAEVELEQEKVMLETRVAERTAQLKQAQMEELQQLYRFAEVGQLSTAMLHDLANHLTVLTLEIEGIHSRQHADALARSSRIIGQLNTMLDEVRDRLSGAAAERDYDLAKVVSDAVELASYKYQAAQVHIDWRPPRASRGFHCFGDPIKCSQVVAILIGNAIDAYDGVTVPSGKPAEVAINLYKDDHEIRLTVTDWGVGIVSEGRSKVFQPSYSTKKSGMGIGLYLAKQMVSTEFAGSLTLSPATDRTEFVVKLPLRKARRRLKAKRHAA